MMFPNEQDQVARLAREAMQDVEAENPHLKDFPKWMDLSIWVIRLEMDFGQSLRFAVAALSIAAWCTAAADRGEYDPIEHAKSLASAAMDAGIPKTKVAAFWGGLRDEYVEGSG